MGCYIWYSEQATGRGRSPPRPPPLAVPNVTAHPSTASVPITVFLYNGPLLCSFNVPIKRLICYERPYYPTARFRHSIWSLYQNGLRADCLLQTLQSYTQMGPCHNKSLWMLPAWIILIDTLAVNKIWNLVCNLYTNWKTTQHADCYGWII